MVGFAVTYLRLAFFDQYYFGVLSLVLWLLAPWARYLSLSILWLIIFAAPMMLGPWEAINGDVPPLPVWEQLMYSVAPLFIPAMFCVQVLHAYKGELTIDLPEILGHRRLEAQNPISYNDILWPTPVPCLPSRQMSRFGQIVA